MRHEVLIPLHAISRLEVQSAEKGVSRSTIATASLVGAASGAGIGLIVGGLREMSECFFACEENHKSGTWAAVGIGTVAGALLGGMVGSMIGTPKWKRVPISPVPLAVSVRPRRDGGVGVALMARF